ncbi:MAG: hypothetical protein KAG12_07700, partial [Desulfuromusa sp.]|nr:hypothetical protein [Desulfuromusa sp.]
MSETPVAVTPTFSPEEILELLAQHYQLTGQLKVLPGYCDQNRLLTGADGCQHIVKIASSRETKLELEMQNAAMIHLVEKGLAVPRVIENRSAELITEIESPTGQRFFLRVLTYLVGVFYADAAPEKTNATLWLNLGDFMAKIDQGLADFQHQGAYRYLVWDLAHGYGICQTEKLHFGRQQRELVDYFL